MQPAAALASETKVLPILANDGQMPKRTELPEGLQRLARLNALSIRHVSFDRDMEYLIDALLARKKPGKLDSHFHRHPVQAGFASALAGLLAAIAFLIVGAAVHGAVTGRSLDQTLGGRGQVVMLITLVVAGGMAAGLLLRPGRKR